MFSRLKIRGKIMTGYVVILAFTVIIAFVAIGWLMMKTSELEELYSGLSAALEYSSVNKQFLGSLTNTIESFRGILYIIAIAIFIVVIIDIVTALKISSTISKPVKKLVNDANQIALGDVDVKTDIKGSDEIADLGRAFQNVINSFRIQADVLESIANGDYTVKMDILSDKDIVGKAIGEILKKNTQLIRQIQEAADEVASGSMGISSGAQSLATGSNEQAATIDELSSTVDHLQSQAKETMNHSIDVDNGIKQVGVLTDTSSQNMNDLIDAMEIINESSNEIAKVIKVIDDIAFQTNILALNAAVEAARAGQHGKGFAVVADEVRVLATKSAEAAKETADLISSSYDKVQVGSGLAEKAGSSMFEITEIIRSNLDNVTKMRDVAEKQSEAVTEINMSLSQITKVVNENSSTAEESAASSEELNAQSEMLKDSISRFKICSNNNDSNSEIPQ